MEKQKFIQLNCGRLTNDDASTLFQLTIEVATPLKAGLGTVASAALTNLETNATPFIDQINRLRENPLTDQIRIVRKQNNNLFSEIKRNVTHEKKSRTEERKTAAINLDYFYKPYWDLPDRGMADHIKDTTTMIAKYEGDETVVANSKTLGTDLVMADLKANNTSLSTLYLTRNEQTGSRAASGTDLRPEASEAYIQFCSAVEQSVNFTPDDSLTTLFNSMNELRVKAHATIPKNKKKPGDDTTGK